jgi:FtsH-binding integral membrane protein
MAVGIPAQNLESAAPDVRVAYLQRVALLVMLGLGVSAFTGVVSALAIAVLPILQNRIASIVVILGSYAVAQFVAPRLVFSQDTTTKWLGFGMGAIFQGVAMGYLLLVAALLGASVFGNPFVLVGQALGLTGLTTVGMVAYLWSRPRELNWIGAMLAMLFLPMLVLMGISFVWPITGPWGIALSALFVFVSAAGLLYQINEVLHRLRSDMFVEGAYVITMGVLVLFWNILTLLMRLQDRR